MYKVASYSTAILIFMALFVPTSYVYLKAILLLIALLTTTSLIYKKKLSFNKTTFFAVIVLSLFGLLNSVHGEINGNSGAFRVLSVLFLWPIVYMILGTLLHKESSITYFNKLLWLTIIVITIYSYLYIGHEQGIVPSFLYIELGQGQDISFYEGFIEYGLYSITSLLFLFPFVTYWIIYNYTTKQVNIKTLLFFSSLVLLAILTGRRAVQLLIIASPLLVILSNLILGIKTEKIITISNKIYKKYLNLLMFIIMFIILYTIIELSQLDISTIYDMLTDGFNFKDGESTSERTDQFISLTKSWYNGNILFGAGNGANTELIRSTEQPWAYELTYIYLLFSNGIIGVIFYFGWFGWGLLRLRKALAHKTTISHHIAAIVTGIFGLGIGAASNPYFGKFDYLWIIILPHLLASSIKYQQSSKS